MVDYVQLPVATTSGDQVASDEIAGLKHQRVKITVGADGVNDGDVSASNPLPVTGVVTTDGLTDAELRASAVPVSIASSPLPTGAATDATLQAVLSLQNEIRDLNDTLITLLSAIFEKMPRVTATDQAAVSIETGTVVVSSLPALGSVINQVQMGGQEALTLARSQIMSGTSHIYNNIEVL